LNRISVREFKANAQAAIASIMEGDLGS
jgi:hypothetical protein